VNAWDGRRVIAPSDACIRKLAPTSNTASVHFTEEQTL
jgi:hypothetical protein